jgi:hypothetical protein
MTINKMCLLIINESLQIIENGAATVMTNKRIEKSAENLCFGFSHISWKKT